jgi:hypothetical protein
MRMCGGRAARKVSGAEGLVLELCVMSASVDYVNDVCCGGEPALAPTAGRLDDSRVCDNRAKGVLDTALGLVFDRSGNRLSQTNAWAAVSLANSYR